MKSPADNKQCIKLSKELKNNMADYLLEHKNKMPEAIALVEADTGKEVSWKEFNQSVDAFAAQLLKSGIKKGDVVATTLPLIKEHLFLMYACFRIGAIAAPLDLRLKEKDLTHCLTNLRPKAYFFLGKTRVLDFRPIVEAATINIDIPLMVQFQKTDDDIAKGAISVKEFTSNIKKNFIISKITRSVAMARKKVSKRDGALIIFTTGSTGSPKPALLCHENILIQNIGIVVGCKIGKEDTIVINLPASHVGCTTEQLLTATYIGCKSVILSIFHARKTLEAIEKYQGTIIAQIPTLFNLEWKLENYDSYNLNSLRLAIYGGQGVSVTFLEKLYKMAPQAGSGLGLTEMAGIVTYTPLETTIEELAQGLGFDSPLCPISIRQPMNEKRMAGAETTPGEVGEICFSGPQVFLGYLNNKEQTDKTVSKDGVCYTGDLGYYNETGLHFSGRSKLIIKPKGFQVFPTEIEKYIQDNMKETVANVACVGAPHETYTECIVLFVEKREGAEINSFDVKKVSKGLANYKHPYHIEIIESGEMPMNRVAKTDYLILKERAKELVQK